MIAATNRVGLSLNYDSQQLTDYRIGCVGMQKQKKLPN